MSTEGKRRAKGLKKEACKGEVSKGKTIKRCVKTRRNVKTRRVVETDEDSRNTKRQYTKPEVSNHEYLKDKSIIEQKRCNDTINDGDTRNDKINTETKAFEKYKRANETKGVDNKYKRANETKHDKYTRTNETNRSGVTNSRGKRPKHILQSNKKQNIDMNSKISKTDKAREIPSSARSHSSCWSTQTSSGANTTTNLELCNFDWTHFDYKIDTKIEYPTFPETSEFYDPLLDCPPFPNSPPQCTSFQFDEPDCEVDLALVTHNYHLTQLLANSLLTISIESVGIESSSLVNRCLSAPECTLSSVSIKLSTQTLLAVLHKTLQTNLVNYIDPNEPVALNLVCLSSYRIPFENSWTIDAIGHSFESLKLLFTTIFELALENSPSSSVLLLCDSYMPFYSLRKRFMCSLTDDLLEVFLQDVSEFADEYTRHKMGCLKPMQPVANLPIPTIPFFPANLVLQPLGSKGSQSQLHGSRLSECLLVNQAFQLSTASISN